MNKVINILKIIFFISVLCLIVISLFPGSLTGLFLYGDIDKTPNTIFSIETTVNHFIGHTYVSTLGFFVYLKHHNFKKMIYYLLFLSISLEILQIIVPNRSFQISDLSANIVGVTSGFLLIRLYILWSRK